MRRSASNCEALAAPGVDSSRILSKGSIGRQKERGVDERGDDCFEAPATKRERVLVAGCGAIGTVFACLLAESGCRVDAIGRGSPSGALEVTGIWGGHHATLE